MVSDFFFGFSHAWSGLTALRTPGLGRFVAWPIVISVAVFAIVIVAAVAGFDALIDWLLAWLPGWLDWLRWLLWPVFALTAMLFAIYLFTLLANLIGAPFNGLLAAKYESYLAGAAPPADNRSLLASSLSSLATEVRKLAYLARWLLLAAVLFLIPVINLIAPIIWLIMGAWLLALEYGGYAMDNHGIDPKRQRQILAGRRGLALGFGAGVMFLSSVPLLNLLAMPAAVLGATRMWCSLGEEVRPSPGDS